MDAGHPHPAVGTALPRAKACAPRTPLAACFGSRSVLCLLLAGCAGTTPAHPGPPEAAPLAQQSYDAAAQECKQRHTTAQDALISTNQPLVEPDPSFTACMDQAKANLERMTK